MSEDLKTLLDEIYGTDSYRLYSQMTCEDPDEDADWPLTEAAFWFCVHYHSGQDSQLYEWSCRLTAPGLFTPGIFDDGKFEEGSTEQLLYDYLVENRVL